ncbi:MAG: precorrin-3B C(17)-methyltransferase [Synergistaceae bacterium]|nr:precorrin-3B C(17)-methyltransferase [Synergistaceae bacterium]
MIYVIGLGPGGPEQITPRALAALEKCDIIVGYKTYIELIKPLFDGRKELVSSSMKKERERCEEVLSLSLSGHTVGLISSGDPGIYGMAGIMLEVAQDKADIEIISGITAAASSAAILGAPIMHDFAVVSLSDLLTPWEQIEKRLIAAADADFVICIYNPVSHGRPDHLARAAEILMKKLPADRIAGWVRNAGRDEENYGLTTLASLPEAPIDMFCTVIIGNSNTRAVCGRMVTPRGYSGN